MNKLAMMLMILSVPCFGLMFGGTDNAFDDTRYLVAGLEISDEPNEPTICKGQIWKCTFTGTEYEVLEVSQEYVVYGYALGSSKTIYAGTKDGFRERCELVVIVLTATVLSSIDFQKPYLYKNPNSGSVMCSKHGDFGFQFSDKTLTFGHSSYDGSITYCDECFWSTVILLIDQHIVGIKELNEVAK